MAISIISKFNQTPNSANKCFLKEGVAFHSFWRVCSYTYWQIRWRKFVVWNSFTASRHWLAHSIHSSLLNLSSFYLCFPHSSTPNSPCDVMIKSWSAGVNVRWTVCLPFTDLSGRVGECTVHLYRGTDAAMDNDMTQDNTGWCACNAIILFAH
jgi:hypothetical protein